MAERAAICEGFPTGLSLPPIQTEQLQSPKAPVTDDGSFFELDRVPKQYIETPVDSSTGVPFPVYPNPELPPAPVGKQKNYERQGDWHHPFHPKATLVQGNLGMRALRACRVQWTKYADHHDGVGYHQTFAGPPLPHHELQLLKTVVFACAGFVGSEALKFAPNGEASIHELTVKERKRLLQPGIIRIDDYYKVKDYLLDYGARHGHALLDASVIDQLLHAGDTKLKERAASAIIAAASEEITGDFQEEFKQAKRERLLPDERTASAANYIRNLLTIRRDGTRSIDRHTLRVLTEALETV